jgi:osmotically-inducible protein OsmY
MIKSDVAQKVSKALAEDERTAECNISVVDKQGVVTLTGSVPVPEARAAAEEIAQEQPGVVEVINDVEVTQKELGEDLIANPPDVRGGLSRNT